MQDRNLSRRASARTAAGALILILSATAPASAQESPDPTAATLPAAGLERAAALAERARELRDEDPERAIRYGSEAARLFEQHAAPERQLPLFLALAEACFHTGDTGGQLAWAERALALAEVSGDDDGRWRALAQISEVRKLRGEFEEALEALGTARGIVEPMADPGKLSEVLDRLGNVYQRQGDFSSAMEHLLEALEIQRQLDDPAALAQVLRDTARVHGVIGELEQALAYYQEALAITQRLGDRRAVAFNRRNLSGILAEMGRGEEALAQAEEALKETEALGDQKVYASLLNNIADMLTSMERYEEALGYADRAVPAIRALDIDRWTVVVLTTRATILTRIGRAREALEALQEAAELSATVDSAFLSESVHEALAEVHEDLGDYRRALEHHRAFKELHDEVFSEDSKRRLAELQARFDAAEKDREIGALEHQRELAMAELTRHRTMRNAAVVGSLLLLGLAAAVAGGYRAKRRAHRRLQRAYGRLESTHRALAEQKAETDQERAVADRLREVDRLKDEFLANTSHELRTPLQGIMGLAESLAEGAHGRLPDAARADLGLLVASGQRLARLVDDILDFSQLKHGKLKLDRRAVDLRALTDVVLALSRPLVGSKELELRAAVPADLPSADADENRLLQILHNLVGNAIKFTESGHVEVAAEVDGDRLAFKVEDTGCGIAPEHLERVFEAFQQADGSAQRAAGGTGLGLAVSRRLVELHGGHLTAESTPGKGSTFIFTLPIADGLPAAPQPETLAADALTDVAIGDAITAERSGREELSPTASILIVDDEPINRRVLANHLGAEGYRVTLAASGAEALRLERRGRPDLVLLDVMMPGMSGYEVCRRMRDDRPLEELPIIFLTARGQAADLVTGLDAGANDYLRKPVARSELLARVRNHLELLSAQRHLERQVDERQRLVEELEATNAELTRFTYTVSHDLKSPLVTIKGFLGLLERDADSGDLERMRHDIRRIQAAAERMRELLEDLLALSRVGRQQNAAEPVDLSELACEALAQVAGRVADLGADVVVDSGLPVVHGDRVRLLEVFQNLLDNAVKYSAGANPPRVVVGRRRDSAETVLYVRDNGMGIEPEYREKVFELFQRLDASTEGTGVGLALVKRIVEVHGGRIWIESEGAGKGSTFCFTLRDVARPEEAVPNEGFHPVAAAESASRET